MTKKLILIASTVIAALLAIGLTADYRVCQEDKQWWTKLNKDLYVGMPVNALREYLKDDGRQNGIAGLIEYNTAGGHWFVFLNHNHSIVFPNNQGAFEGYVGVWLSTNETVKDIHAFE